MATSATNVPSDNFVDNLFPLSEPQHHHPSAMLQAQALQQNASKARKRKVNNLRRHYYCCCYCYRHHHYRQRQRQLQLHCRHCVALFADHNALAQG
jgi:hypothetical protein